MSDLPARFAAAQAGRLPDGKLRAMAEAKRQSVDGWRRLLNQRVQRLCKRGLIRYAAERWELACVQTV